MRQSRTLYQFDWVTLVIYFSLVVFGWFTIYAASYDIDADYSIFSLSQNSGRQLIWIAISFIPILAILVIDFKVYDSFGYVLYGSFILLLVFVLVFGREVAGSKSWIELGSFRLQPAEFAKFGTVLALSKYISGSVLRSMKNLKDQITCFALIGLPSALILLQGDAGSAMVYPVLIFALYREGLSPLLLYVGIVAIALLIGTLLINQTMLLITIIVLGLLSTGLVVRSFKKITLVIILTVAALGFVTSIDFLMTNVLKPHQQKRMLLLVNPNTDPLGAGWNITQSKIAIGSGGFAGKGFLNGTQTQFDFVPEQSTDFIFSTVGEERGWIGTTLLIVAFLTLFLRLIFLAERQKSSFARIYGYGTACILFFHFAINIAMTIGLFPVAGIPLPFISYGGSSLWSFTILLFVFLKLDAHRMQILERGY